MVEVQDQDPFQYDYQVQHQTTILRQQLHWKIILDQVVEELGVP